MKKVFLIYLVLLSFSCKSIKNQEFHFDRCNILQAVLHQKDINWMIGLDIANDIRPVIRIFDLSGNFEDVEHFTQVKALIFLSLIL